MDIASTITALTALQATVAISSPVSSQIKKAYPYGPNQAAVAPDCPCFMNDWSLIKAELSGDELWELFDIHMQLLVDDADRDRAAAIATAFYTAFRTAWIGAQKLSGTWSYGNLRGGVPTLALMTRADRSYIGLDLHFDAMLKTAVTPVP